MSRFRKNNRRSVPSLNTAALPDLIFTLLFFFLLVTNMRSAPSLTQVELPNASELQKLKEKSLLVYILVGRPTGENPDEPFEIQLNSELIAFDAMHSKLLVIKEKIRTEEQDKMVVILKMDKDTPMGLVNDVRQNLRETNLHTVYYMVEKSRNVKINQ
jgi:biopolymer transport protein ExbD